MKTAPKKKKKKINKKTAQAKSQGDSSFEGQRVFEEQGKTESRAYEENFCK